MTQFDFNFWRRKYQLLPEETANHQHLNLARIAFAINRRDHGRLRQLIDAVNGV